MAWRFGTVLMRRYGSVGSLRSSPAITLTEDGRSATLPARNGTGQYDCPLEGNCTNAFELSDPLRRIGLNERIADGERFRLTRQDLAYLRYALASATKPLVTAGAEEALGKGNVLVYRKGGLAGGWRTDNAFLRDRKTGVAYLITIALSDAEPLDTFAAIARAVLDGMRSGRLRAPAL